MESSSRRGGSAVGTSGSWWISRVGKIEEEVEVGEGVSYGLGYALGILICEMLYNSPCLSL
jgi:hypothetical protein